MKLSEFKKISDTYTSKSSDICRQLALGGIAIIWLFKINSNGTIALERFLLYPLISLSISLISDLLQYVLGGYIWKRFFITEEKKAIALNKEDSINPLDPEIKASKRLNKPIYYLYWIKIGVMIISYILIIIYMIHKVNLN
jgi:hypothetical protein